MKKLTTMLVAIAFAFSGFVMPVNAVSDLSAGTVVKTENSSTLYYIGDDGKLYVFPNSKTYYSWFSEFENIVTITDEKFGSYQLGGNVRYKPGSLLVKTPTSFKVYAVGLNGELRWVKSEELAKQFYGNNWNKLVDDVPDGFFTNYSFGNPIENEDEYNPDEEEEQSPTISHNRKWKVASAIKNRLTNRYDRHCENLKNSMNRLTKRAEKFGFQLPDVSEEYYQACENVADRIKDKKIYFCKIDADGSKHTVNVSKNAMFAHLKNGGRIGRCDDSDDDTVTTALSISNVYSTSTDADSTTIKWQSNKLANSKVEYSLKNDLSSSTTEVESAKTTEHEIELSGLISETKYYYKVISETGDESKESEIKFFTTVATGTTDEIPPVISNVKATTTNETATITWTTNELSDSRVVYATETIASTTDIDDKSSSSNVISHTIIIDGLASSTTYYFYVESEDTSDNTAKSEEFEFETLE